MRKCNGSNEINEETSGVTVLLCSALARCSAPTAAILFNDRLSVVSVWMRRCKGGNKIDGERSNVTVFLCSALARCSALTSPIPWSERPSVVSA